MATELLKAEFIDHHDIKKKLYSISFEAAVPCPYLGRHMNNALIDP